jgi:hypothetical protein
MNVTSPRRSIGLFLVLRCIVATSVVADEFHFINTFIGDRAAGMGGAYTAIADGSKRMYYNPAGLAFPLPITFHPATDLLAPPPRNQGRLDTTIPGVSRLLSGIPRESGGTVSVFASGNWKGIWICAIYRLS